jgi:hypothetical protein
VVELWAVYDGSAFFMTTELEIDDFVSEWDPPEFLPIGQQIEMCEEGFRQAFGDKIADALAYEDPYTVALKASIRVEPHLYVPNVN